MFYLFAWLGVMALGATGPERSHQDNPIFQALLNDQVQLAGTPIRFDPPVLREGQSAADQQAALRKVAGSEAKANDLLRDSVSAPFILKVRDLATRGETLIRVVDLWFVVHADLDAIDPAEAESAAASGKPVEAGNMRFTSTKVSPEDLKAKGIDAPAPTDDSRPTEWYVHLTGRLLDRIHVEATDHIIASRSADSLVVASRTAERLGKDGPLGNRWQPIDRRGGQEKAETARPYAGGAGYVAIGRFKPKPGALLVEAHFAFAEPRDWFHGAPILRSKIGLVTQDRIRSLRRDLAKERSR